MTLTREQIRELAEFQDAKSCALSFYFQPAAPRNKAHKEDAILIKDLAREALRTVENKERKELTRSDMDRILRLSADFRSNGTHAKAVFACAAHNFWRAYDLPPVLPGTQVFVDRHFHLKPLAHLPGAFPRLGIVLVDRHRARIFDLRLSELTEREGLFQPLSRKGRSDGFAGYDGGHAQRRVDDEARQHFKAVAETVKDALAKGIIEKWILGCQEAHRSQLEPQLGTLAKQHMVGRFSADLGHISGDEIRTRAEHIMEEWKNRRCQEIVAQALGQSRGRSRGVTGLRRVLRSLEMGEVQTLLIGEAFLAHAVECSGCGHLDAHLVNECPVCGRATHEVVDVGEAILPKAIHRDIELFYVKENPEFDRVGNIAALLRFRSEQNLPAVADISAHRALEEDSNYSAYLRRPANR